MKKIVRYTIMSAIVGIFLFLSIGSSFSTVNNKITAEDKATTVAKKKETKKLSVSSIDKKKYTDAGLLVFKDKETT